MTGLINAILIYLGTGTFQNGMSSLGFLQTYTALYEYINITKLNDNPDDELAVLQMCCTEGKQSSIPVDFANDYTDLESIVVWCCARMLFYVFRQHINRY